MVDLKLIFQNVDWPNLIAGFIFSFLSTIIFWIIKGFYEYHRASENITMKITGSWYSVEFDTKGTIPYESRNTILEVELNRNFGDKVTIKSIKFVHPQREKEYETNWLVKGKLKGETLVGEWFSTAKSSRRFGAVFLKFLDHGRARRLLDRIRRI